MTHAHTDVQVSPKEDGWFCAVVLYSALCLYSTALKGITGPGCYGLANISGASFDQGLSLGCCGVLLGCKQHTHYHYHYHLPTTRVA
jgi:hypothetical protein